MASRFCERKYPGQPGRRAPILVAAALLLAFVGFVPAVASAQSAFSGTVKDTSGGVLPGVTVEASSPALIEKVRVGVTDSAGQFSITALPPGRYTVTFSLPGFATVRREGIDLVTGFTGNVDAELPVGSLEESITVTGASPVVDVQNTARERVMSKEMIDVLPTGRMYGAFGVLVPGVNSTGKDVGGAAGATFDSLTAHRFKTPESWTNAPVSAVASTRSGAVMSGRPLICDRCCRTTSA